MSAIATVAVDAGAGEYVGPARSEASVERVDGYAPIGSYGVIGDGRTAALVAGDGSIDWLCLPELDGPSVFAALLDPQRGGHYRIAPASPFESSQRYRSDTNVLETTFTTADGVARVTDALTLQEGRLLPWVELVRRVEGVTGAVTMDWRLQPRFDYGRRRAEWRRERGHPVARWGPLALSLSLADAGMPLVDHGALTGTFAVAAGSTHLLCVTGAYAQPVVFPHLEQVDLRVDRTADFWAQRASAIAYEGPWREAVVRSGLALQLLVTQRSGGIAAAATMGLPERIGGSANFDYRYQWVRDASFVLDACMGLGMQAQAHASFAALQRAVQHTHPRPQPMYRLDGGPRLPDETLDLRGYRDSRPVRVGNGAAGQLQLGNFGDLLDTTWRYTSDGHLLDPATGQRVAQIADLVTGVWRNDDSGIWELKGSQRPYTNSKMACWLALERAVDLADAGQIPAGRRAAWRAGQRRIHEFVEARCWSTRRNSYTFYAGTDELDASVLLSARMGYRPDDDDRVPRTIAAIRGELADGPFVYRYSGTQPQEGAFLACSFWLAEALALTGDVDAAAGVMDDLVAVASPVGLLSEEIDPSDRTLLGNYPQGLSHLALVNAALVIQRAG